MAQLGFGLNINETAQETGYDQYATGLKQALGAVAADNWKFNPISSLLTAYDVENSRTVAKEQFEPLIDRNELNKQYRDLGLVFEKDEPQRTVDIIVNLKKEERKRQSIISRGPEGKFSNLFAPSILKFATGLGVSILDPINIGVSFIPVVGQARFAQLAARQGLTKARLARGTVEGFAGATLVEPLVYGVAQSVQADYGLTDSFYNLTFGTFIGGGLHVGVGKLKDIRTAAKFKERIRKAEAETGVKLSEEQEVNLYREYYPENSEIMQKLATSDPETKRLLLAKSVGDVLSEEPVNVKQVAEADSKLRTTTDDAPTPVVETVQKVNARKDLSLNDVEQSVQNRDDKAQDLEIETLEQQLNDLKQTQAARNLEIDDVEVREATRADEDLTTNEAEAKKIIRDGINCINGR